MIENHGINSFKKQQVTDAVTDICMSKFFKNSPQLCAFFNFVIEQTLNGNPKTIKAYTIATQALGRSDDFDPQADPIVRVQAQRMRIALDRYYSASDANASVRISFRRGSYVPIFSTGKDAKLQTPASAPVQAVSNDPQPQRILVLDADPKVGAQLVKSCRKLGFEVVLSTSVEEFIPAITTFCPTNVIMDIIGVEFDGIELLHTMADQDCVCGVLLTGHGDPAIFNALVGVGKRINLNMAGNIRKPFDSAELEITLGHMIKTKSVSKAEIDTALRESQFALMYQPKMSLDKICGGQICGFESFLRWNHPVKGIIYPSQFLHIAEESEQIDQIIEWVIVQAIDYLARLHARGIDVDISVNLAARNLTNPELPEWVAHLLAKARLSPQHLILEITEATVNSNALDIIDILARFSLKGIPLALDQFGNGFGGLRSLYQEPFCEIKIDRSVIHDIETNKEAAIIVKSIINLAHELNSRVCAVGVETAGCLQILRAMGCNSAQGYFISMPQFEDDLELFFAERFKPCAMEHICTANRSSFAETSATECLDPLPEKLCRA